jgi:ABC-type multidrug transport system fused ATPase/permease subunit
MFRYLLIIIGIIVLYKLIFDFIIPIYRASKQVKARFREMNEQMQDRVNTFEQNRAQPQEQSSSSKTKDPSNKDYIDFEEIK